MAVLVPSDLSTPLRDEDADKKKDAPGPTARAFECPRCQVVIFENEFTDGKFVPPQFRLFEVKRAGGRRLELSPIGGLA